jgi:prepilin-type N-terminal cleavage/methylation domain-containing protein
MCEYYEYKQADHAEDNSDSWSAFLIRVKTMSNQKKLIIYERKAFTIIEILIVVVILGILAAVVMPMVSEGAISARVSALATDIQLLNRFILVYKAHHLEVPPGYPNGQTSSDPTEQAFIDQATLVSNTSGQTAAIGTSGYERGPYMERIPINPLNKLRTIQMLGNGESFPSDGDNSHGWIYKASTGEIHADSPGTDENGKKYYEY